MKFFSAAHGLCAILQMLISVPGYIDGLGNCQARDDIQNSIGMCNTLNLGFCLGCEI